MKYSAHLYAKALALTAADPKFDAKRFLEVVRGNGDEHLLPKILEEAEMLLARSGGIRKVRIESARALGPAGRKAVEHFLKPGDITEEHVDPDLVAGIKIVLDGELQFDGSMRGKLDQMFANI